MEDFFVEIIYLIIIIKKIKEWCYQNINKIYIILKKMGNPHFLINNKALNEINRSDVLNTILTSKRGIENKINFCFIRKYLI